MAEDASCAELSWGFSHPVLFVFDMSNPEVVVPEIGADFQVASSLSCITVRVMPAVDGEVRVSLSSQLPPQTEHRRIQIFAGELMAPSSVLSVSTAEMDEILSLNVGSSPISMVIYVDELAHPAHAWIEAGCG